MVSFYVGIKRNALYYVDFARQERDLQMGLPLIFIVSGTFSGHVSVQLQTPIRKTSPPLTYLSIT